MIPLRCRGQTNASAASRPPLNSAMEGKRGNKRFQLPAVLMLLILSLLYTPLLCRPVVVYAQDRAAVTRVREYFPPTESLPGMEIYYPQISFGGNPNQLQTANAMMREYAIRKCHMRQQAARLGQSDIPSDGKLIDYRITRNSGGFFSIAFTEFSSLAEIPPHGFTVRLSDQKVCRLADLFLSNTNYPSLLDQEISRIFQTPFEGIRHNTSFFLTDDSLVLLPAQDEKDENQWSNKAFEVPLSAPAVREKLAVGLAVGHTRAEPYGEPTEQPGQSPEEPEDVQQDVLAGSKLQMKLLR